MKYKFPVNLLGLLLLLFGLNSCKVKYSMNGGTVPADAKTISIHYFPNHAALAKPTLSQTFTEALKDYFTSQTNLALVDQNGDLDLEGSITGYTTSPVAIQTNDQASLTRLTITVQVKYTNKFDKTKDFNTSFSRYADYASSQSLSSVEDGLISQIDKQLVEDIYNRALNNW